MALKPWFFNKANQLSFCAIGIGQKWHLLNSSVKLESVTPNKLISLLRGISGQLGVALVRVVGVTTGS